MTNPESTKICSSNGKTLTIRKFFCCLPRLPLAARTASSVVWFPGDWEALLPEWSLHKQHMAPRASRTGVDMRFSDIPAQGKVSHGGPRDIWPQLVLVSSLPTFTGTDNLGELSTPPGASPASSDPWHGSGFGWSLWLVLKGGGYPKLCWRGRLGREQLAPVDWRQCRS